MSVGAGTKSQAAQAVTVLMRDATRVPGARLIRKFCYEAKEVYVGTEATGINHSLDGSLSSLRRSETPITG
ncbi:hypothetical protein Mycsm_04739 [Mycobacterium sp. JS623]|nr:hypothetical protein Mycsm_04739 [Mycobacterium sp. JS623]